jgi:hypothetical protein
MKIVWGRSIGWNMSFNGMEKFSPGTFTPMEQTIITDGAGCYPWTETFIMWPKTSITGRKLFWTKAYKRKVWVVWGTGFHMEPTIQYADVFDLLKNGDNI